MRSYDQMREALDECFVPAEWEDLPPKAYSDPDTVRRALLDVESGMQTLASLLRDLVDRLDPPPPDGPGEQAAA